MHVSFHLLHNLGARHSDGGDERVDVGASQTIRDDLDEGIVENGGTEDGEGREKT